MGPNSDCWVECRYTICLYSFLKPVKTTIERIFFSKCKIDKVEKKGQKTNADWKTALRGLMGHLRKPAVEKVTPAPLAPPNSKKRGESRPGPLAGHRDGRTRMPQSFRRSPEVQSPALHRAQETAPPSSSRKLDFFFN